MIYLADDMLNNMLKNNERVMVDFYAQWCGPCRALSPFVEKLAEEFKNVLVCKANVEDAPVIAEKLGVQNLPCVVFFKNGEEVNRVVGNNQAKIREIIESL